MVNSRVIVVEDERIVAIDIKNMLKSLGYNVLAIVSSGPEAIKKIEEAKPDLVLMDIKLNEDMDGVEAADKIRSLFKIPVVYLTAYADDDTLQRAKKTSPYGYILKPFEEKELSTTIEIALHKSNIEREVREETENALATIIGGAELILDEGAQRHDQETLHKAELIRNAALIIKETIEKL
jgi:CheY-like chemotaxis protein